MTKNEVIDMLMYPHEQIEKETTEFLDAVFEMVEASAECECGDERHHVKPSGPDDWNAVHNFARVNSHNLIQRQHDLFNALFTFVANPDEAKKQAEGFRNLHIGLGTITAMNDMLLKDMRKGRMTGDATLYYAGLRARVERSFQKAKRQAEEKKAARETTEEVQAMLERLFGERFQSIGPGIGALEVDASVMAQLFGNMELTSKDKLN